MIKPVTVAEFKKWLDHLDDEHTVQFWMPNGDEMMVWECWPDKKGRAFNIELEPKQ